MTLRYAGALGAAAALALAAGSVTATDVKTDCPPINLATHNLTDYIRFSTTSDRLYVENGACVTMTEIFEARLDSYSGANMGPLYPFDETTKQITENVTGSWFLGSSLYVTGGSRLVVQGSAKGGDCDHLLLASNKNKHINVRAHGGEILIDGTHVESWDMQAGGVDEIHEDGRSYISAISEVVLNPEQTCEGRAMNSMGEARLDIIDSEINHLGYYESESYGIAYKVRGLCKDNSNLDLFDEVSVTGDILGSHIHNNFFGHYAFGHQGGNWSYNEVHDNIGYGFDPHDDSDYVTINNNHVHHNGWHGIIASKRCDHVSIQNNHVHDNGHITEDGKGTGNGIMLHRSSDFATIKGNEVHDNMDSGIALYESSHCKVSRNKLYHNKNGIRMSMGSSDNAAFENHIVINGADEKYAIYLYMGNDVPGVDGSDGRPRFNRVYNNTLISDNAVVMMRNADDNTIEDNTIVGLVSRFTDSLNTLWVGNSVPRTHVFKVEDGSCFNAFSDMDSPISGGSHFYSYDYDFFSDYEAGFFCGM